MEDVLWAGLTDSYTKLPMAITAENLAEQYGLSREDCDKYALQSQQRWAKGISWFCQHILSFSVIVHYNTKNVLMISKFKAILLIMDMSLSKELLLV